MAGVEGFEPPNAGTRNQCLTTWRHPNSVGAARASITNCTIFSVLAQGRHYYEDDVGAEADLFSMPIADNIPPNISKAAQIIIPT